jgi:glycosyltransferase involved in cell wall biosynthesis
MKLLVDAHCFDYKTTEGVNTYLKGLYSELIKFTSDIEFYFVAYNVEKIKQIFGEATNTHYIKLNSRNKIYRLLFEFPAIIKKYRIDIAHYQYVSPIIKNCKTIITLHDILFVDFPQYFPLSYRLKKNLLFRQSAKRANLLLTVSRYSKKQISFHYKIPSIKIYVTPNAVSRDFWNINKNEANNFIKKQGIGKYILYISRIEPRKNQIELLRAYFELKLWEENYDLVFIGRKSLSFAEFDNYYKSLPKEVKVRIHIINQATYQELKYWYRCTSLFVYPALAEGFGIPPIEAGACGVPCICSNKTAMGDFTFFGDNLIDISNIELLKETIKRNLTNDTKVNNTAVSQEIFKQYNWNQIARNFYTLISTL